MKASKSELIKEICQEYEELEKSLKGIKIKNYVDLKKKVAPLIKALHKSSPIKSLIKIFSDTSQSLFNEIEKKRVEITTLKKELKSKRSKNNDINNDKKNNLKNGIKKEQKNNQDDKELNDKKTENAFLLVQKVFNEQSKSIKKAQEVQSKLNTETIPNLGEYNAACYYMPCEQLGGDYFEIKRWGMRIVIIIADCTGHGIEASMDATLLKSISDRHMIFLTDMRSPAAFLELVNNDFLEYTHDEQYPTMFAAVLDLEKQTLIYSNANGELPYIINNGNVDRLDAPGAFFLGFFKESKYENNEINLKPSDTIFFYSDALVEIETLNNKRNSRKYIEKLLKQFGKNINEDLDQLLSEIKKMNNGFPLKDDLTLIVLQNIERFERRYVVQSTEGKLDIFTELNLELKKRSYCTADINSIMIALEEVFTNAYYHGNKEDKTKNININILIDCELTEIVVEDEGDGFSFDEVPDPTDINRFLRLYKSGNIEELIRGRGIWFCREYLDEIVYSYKGNRVSLKKKRTPKKSIFQYY